MQGTKWAVKIGLDLYGSADLGVFLREALWMLRVMERVLRVLAASFDLSSTSDWYDELAKFKARLDKFYMDLDQIVNPIHQDTE
jgi:hypothetical protein